MQRDALFVDIPLSCPSNPQEKKKTPLLRLCTTHLESRRASPPKRPAQLVAAAAHLRQAHVGILGGDLNAIEEFDRSLHAENGLRDAYLEMGGVEGAEGGMTWGQMAGRAERARFGLTRMDKLLFCGEGVKVVGFGRFGMDVVVEEEGAAKRLLEGPGGLERAWVTDHLGVRAEFLVGGDGGVGPGREVVGEEEMGEERRGRGEEKI
jgi:tyrosyl-DNA phosphodiesterase 2